MQNKAHSSSNKKRLVVAALVLPLLLSYLYFLPHFPYFLILVLIVGVGAMWELSSMYKVPLHLTMPGIIAGGALLYVFCIHPEYSIYGIFIAILVLMLMRLFIAESPEGSMSELGPVGIGFLYISGSLSFQWFLRSSDEFDGLSYIFFLYLSIWLADSMAYYVGTYMGNKKLCPTISPNKTVEGAIGSLIGGTSGALISKAVFNLSEFSYPGIAVTGLVLGVATLLGDLIESMLKRDAGVKDSSNLLPEHGGILDKIDGHLVSGPVLYIIVRFF